MPDEALTGYETVVVTGSNNLSSGTDSSIPEVHSHEHRLATAELHDPAWQEVHTEINPSEHEPGDHVATIYYDVADSWYGIDYFLDDEEEQ